MKATTDRKSWCLQEKYCGEVHCLSCSRQHGTQDGFFVWMVRWGSTGGLFFLFGSYAKNHIGCLLDLVVGHDHQPVVALHAPQPTPDIDGGVFFVEFFSLEWAHRNPVPKSDA